MQSDTAHIPPQRKEVLMLAVCIFLFLIPFVNKAYHIDDPFYIWTGQQILESPLDFYGYTINWSGIEVPASLENKNPPLVSYYMALVGLLFGWREWPMHLAFMLPAIGVGIGTYFLACRFCAKPALASMLAIITPAFLVSSTNVMAEIVMLFFYVWALYFWMTGLESGRSRLMILGALCIAGATLSKYYGLSLIPLLVLYSLLEKKRVGKWLFYMGGAVGIILVYEAWTIILYGFGLLGEAGKFATAHTQLEEVPRNTKLFIGIAFTGGCILIPILLSPLVMSWRILAPCFAIGGYFFFVAYTYPNMFPETIEVSYANPDWKFIRHFVAFSVMGILVLVIPVQDLWRHRDNDSLFLALWVFGTFIFASQVNWTTNARSIVPMAPAIGILLVRQLDHRYPSNTYPWKRIVLFSSVGLVISMLLNVGDYSLANASKRAASTFQSELPEHDGEVWFTGHWGFQYYMQEWGAKPIDISIANVAAGDILIEPVNNTSNDLRYNFSDQAMTTIFEVSPYITTWNPWRRAGFYSNKMGSLPFATRRIPNEVYNIFLINKDMTLDIE